MLAQKAYDQTFLMLHEASHAVIGEKLGGTVRAIVISPGHGHVDIDGLADESEASAVMYLAGNAASRRFNESEQRDNTWRQINGRPPVRTEWAVPSKEDEDGVRRYMQANYFSAVSMTEQRERARLEMLARQQVDQHWRTICDVALALSEVERGGRARLDRAAFLKAMGGAT